MPRTSDQLGRRLGRQKVELDSMVGSKAGVGLGYQEPHWLAEWAVRTKLETADE